jgi:hypothetical protein
MPEVWPGKEEPQDIIAILGVDELGEQETVLVQRAEQTPATRKRQQGRGLMPAGKGSDASREGV